MSIKNMHQEYESYSKLRNLFPKLALGFIFVIDIQNHYLYNLLAKKEFLINRIWRCGLLEIRIIISLTES